MKAMGVSLKGLGKPLGFTEKHGATVKHGFHLVFGIHLVVRFL
jgi:hypothetical protein